MIIDVFTWKYQDCCCIVNPFDRHSCSYLPHESTMLFIHDIISCSETWCCMSKTKSSTHSSKPCILGKWYKGCSLFNKQFRETRYGSDIMYTVPSFFGMINVGNTHSDRLIFLRLNNMNNLWIFIYKVASLVMSVHLVVIHQVIKWCHMSDS